MMGNSVICTINFIHGIPAKLYTPETWFVSGSVQGGDDDEVVDDYYYNNNTFITGNSIICTINFIQRIPAKFYTPETLFQERNSDYCV